MSSKKSSLALLPLGVFLVLYLVVSIVIGDFYKMPVTVAFLVSAVVALFMYPSKPLTEKVDVFCKGAGQSNIMIMIVIFILAGAFANSAKVMGAVDSTVNIGLTILPESIIVTGIFIIGCFISLSVGTSVGTIVALTPMALDVATKINLPIGLVVGAVVSGAMFGDNLSMISDTTIAASRTQGCEMRDKFKMNFLIVLPAAILSGLIFMFLSSGHNIELAQTYDYNLLKVVPYIVVLLGALLGFNVMGVLIFGTALSGAVGIYTGAFDAWGFVASINEGIAGMSEVIIISILVGGIVEIIKYNGGIDFLLDFITSKIHSKKGAEFGIGILISLVNMCTANNTIAIVTAGPIAKDISEEYGIEPRRTASILDTFSCFTQGIIPYGAQLLIAAGLAGISSIEIMRFLFYPYLMGICVMMAIAVGFPSFKSSTKVTEVAGK